MKTGLIIIAHPDDETMFCGGTIVKLNLQWTVVSAAHGLDSQRGKEFQAACRVLGVTPLMLNVQYGGKDSEIPISVDEVENRMNRVIEINNYDLVITHNDNGEFGNQDHIAVNKVVQRNRNNLLWKIGFNLPDADIIIKLNQRQREVKQQAMSKYVSQKNRINLIEIKEESFMIENS